MDLMENEFLIFEEAKTYYGKPNLEERTFLFAKSIRELIKNLPKSIANNEDGKQLIRSSGSVGANYIEANESISRKDLAFRIKICKKEAKESVYWLKLLDTEGKNDLEISVEKKIKEANELVLIFMAILKKVEITE